MALHTAMVFGLPMQIFVSVMGLIVVTLSVTGVVIWLKKRQGRQRTATRRAVLDKARAGDSPGFRRLPLRRIDREFNGPSSLGSVSSLFEKNTKSPLQRHYGRRRAGLIDPLLSQALRAVTVIAA